MEHVGEAYHYPTLGRAVKLRDCKGGDGCGAGEFLRLLEGILAGGCVQHQQHFVRSTFERLAAYAAYLGQLVHQVHTVVQTACGVDKHYIRSAGDGGLHGIEGDGGRIGTGRLLDDVHSGPFGPDVQLVHCCSAEGIGRTHQHLQPPVLVVRRKLAYGGGLAHAVHANYQYYIWFGAAGLAGDGRIFAAGTLQQGCNLFPEVAHELLERHHLVTRDALLQVVDNLEGGIHAHVALDEGFLDGVEGVVIYS